MNDNIDDILKQLIDYTNELNNTRDKIVEFVNGTQAKNLKSIRDNFNEIKFCELKMSGINKLIEYKLDKLQESKYQEDKSTLVKLQIEHERLAISKFGTSSADRGDSEGNGGCGDNGGGEGGEDCGDSWNSEDTERFVFKPTGEPLFVSLAPDYKYTINCEPSYHYFKSVSKYTYSRSIGMFGDAKYLALKCNKYDHLVYNVMGFNYIGIVDINTMVVLPNKQFMFSNGDEYLRHTYNLSPMNSVNGYEGGSRHKFDYLVGDGPGVWHKPNQDNNGNNISSVFKFYEFTTNTMISTNKKTYYDIVFKTQYSEQQNQYYGNNYSLSPMVNTCKLENLTYPNVYIMLTLSFDDIKYDQLKEIFV